MRPTNTPRPCRCQRRARDHTPVAPASQRKKNSLRLTLPRMTVIFSLGRRRARLSIELKASIAALHTKNLLRAGGFFGNSKARLLHGPLDYAVAAVSQPSAFGSLTATEATAGAPSDFMSQCVMERPMPVSKRSLAISCTTRRLICRPPPSMIRIALLPAGGTSDVSEGKRTFPLAHRRRRDRWHFCAALSLRPVFRWRGWPKHCQTLPAHHDFLKHLTLWELQQPRAKNQLGRPAHAGVQYTTDAIHGLLLSPLINPP